MDMKTNNNDDKYLPIWLILVGFVLLIILTLISDSLFGQQDPLNGDVKVVPCCATYKVKVVDHNPDYIIRVVNSKPINNYEWRFVRTFPDFTIQFVDFGEDFRVKLFNY